MKPARFIFLFVLFSILCSLKTIAQVKNYESQWKKVDELIQKKNLPKSAIAEVNKIYTQAKKEKQDAQVIKALVYMISLQNTEEESDISAIKQIETEIPTSSEPAASILQSMLASRYWQYLQNNRWKFYNRTNTVAFDKKDIATWTLEDLHKKIGALYLASIKNESLLKSTNLEPYDAIIVKGNVRFLRPTLYDLLAHEALDYFKNDEADLKKPAYAFEIVQPQAFAAAPEFVKYRFTTKDSLSLHHKALLIYQELIQFHLQDTKPYALFDVDIERLEFVFNNSVAENKDSLYTTALTNLIQSEKNLAVIKQAQYLLALWYENKATTYQPLKDTTYRDYRIKARDILADAVKDSAVKNEGWTNCYNLLKSVEAESFSFEMEKVNIPSKPFRALVKYRNITGLNLRLVRYDEGLRNQLEKFDDEDKFWTFLTKAKPIKSWIQSLPVTNDLQQHAVEIKIESLPVGEYFLLASVDDQFQTKNNALGFRTFFVSNISYVNQKENFFMLNRETGQPLAQSKVIVYNQEYDYKTSKYIKTKLGTYQSDDHGYFKLPPNKDNRRQDYYLDISHKDDRLNLDEASYNFYYFSTAPEKPVNKIFFFTDRSIYRPGQTVYFKGIVINNSGRQNEILTDYKTTIYLRDANNQNIDSAILTTNDFGSFNARFHLPQNILNGNFQLVEKGNTLNSIYISVEEYKRPKFQVEFEKIAKSYKVNEQVSVAGTAKAYAGNNIDGAKVVYRVVRQPRFLYSWYFSKWWMPPVEEMEIAHGETTTDKDGKFNVNFTAFPDKTIDIKFNPVFDYRIYADVTDINGETRSNEKLVTAGYQSLVLEVNIPERMPVDSFRNISVLTQNMNGEYQPSMVTVSVSKLHPEQRLIRDRYWEQPDQFVMSKAEYVSFFSHDEYNNETNKITWGKETPVIKIDSTRVNGEFAIDNKQLSAGYYEIIVSTKDKDGNEIKDVKYVEIFDPKSNTFNRPEYLWTKGSSKAIAPGESAQLQVGSSANNVYVVEQVAKRINDSTTIPPFNYSTLNNGKKSFTYPVTEADRGGFGVGYFFVKDNRFYQNINIISVPWTNKELEIEWASFRDKTLPGSEEKWKVKIKGYKSEKLAAEMLASMYDASLDQFRDHQWLIPNVWPTNYLSTYWSSDQNFSQVNSEENWVAFPSRVYNKIFDQFRFNLYQIAEINQLADRKVNYLDGFASVQKAKFNPPLMKRDEEVATDSTSSLSYSWSYGQSQTDRSFENQNVPVQIRKNFNETAFFFPDLRTDAEGNIEFSFTTPEALTKWKLQTFAHTKNLAFGYSQKELVTQKDLMVQPNMPRFLRQGDHIELSVKIVNLSQNELTGQAQLQLFDASTNQSVDGWFLNSFPNQYFTVAAGQSEVVKFPVQVPVQFNSSLTWRVVASSGSFSDGEENALPVLSNKVLVTETMPLAIRGSETKNFSFEKLLQSGNSPTLQNQSLTIEYTSNPAWYAVQALPYLMEYPYECAEQTWNRFYANALASKIVNAAPRIKQIFERWKTLDTAALLSNLQKNQELKSALLEETPWVLQAKSENEQKKNIALLFDLVRLSGEMENHLSKLRDMQSSNGGFVWFKGGPDDRYITQYILTGIGHLKKLGVDVKNLESIVNAAIPYLDKKLKDDYDQLVKSKAKLNEQQIGPMQIQYLYMRSFFTGKNIPQATKTAFDYYKKQARTFWMKQNQYSQGMIALALYRNADAVTSAGVLKSLKETSIVNAEMGRYWKDNNYGRSWYWWYAPIETQALLIEAFSEINKDTKTADELRTWLIKNKQTNNWRTTKATADACYAMLLQGTDWISNEPVVQIKLGTTTISSGDQKTEAGTGYFKQTIDGQNVKPSMGNISVSVQQANNAPSWGAVYWQYFEDMDKVTTASTPLKLEKKLFVEKNTDRGPVLSPVADGAELHVGDKIKVRIELRVDRDMEYVHMKDMRASALEPVNVLSSYKWQDGLGYYESTKDASTNFFFNDLRKGTYVFEYPLFVTHAGTFSNGITTIQCMYAPEFSAHSEGVKINVE